MIVRHEITSLTTTCTITTGDSTIGAWRGFWHRGFWPKGSSVPVCHYSGGGGYDRGGCVRTPLLFVHCFLQFLLSAVSLVRALFSFILHGPSVQNFVLESCSGYHNLVLQFSRP